MHIVCNRVEHYTNSNTVTIEKHYNIIPLTVVILIPLLLGAIHLTCKCEFYKIGPVLRFGRQKS